MAGIKFDATLDTRHFTDGMSKIQADVRRVSHEIKESGLSMEQYLNNIKSAAAAVAAGFSAKAFISQMVQVRGEFQQLEVAFKTMLGSEEKAAALMEQLTKTAAVTPFDLQGVTNGAKQLLAYGVAADEVNDTLVHLGDIAAGLSLPLGDLVYLYGTTMTQGRMFTQDLRQFMGRGIPIAEELAKQFGVTKDKVGELVTAGKVGADEFKRAIMAMSSEGGKFAGLMEAQSKTITGQISNIEDAIDGMFNNLGKQSEGIINGTLSVVSSLVENYQKVGEVIGGVVATYGTYKAAVMTVTALQGLQAAGIGALTAAETIHYGWLVLCEKAQKLLNATMLANPYVLAATAVAGLVAVMVTMKSEQERVNEAYDDYNQKKADIIRKEEEHKARIEELARVAGDESLSTDTRRKALVELEQKYPAIFAKYDTETEKLKHIRDLKAEIAALDGKSSITKASYELDKVEKRIKELETIHTDSFINSAGGRTYTGRNRNESENAELKALERRRKELANEIKKDQGNTYLTNLTGISNADLKKQIDERRNLIAKMDVSGKKYGNAKKGGVTGIYTKDELQGQLQILESELSRRKKVLEDSTKNFVAEANASYKKEQEALKKLESLTDPKKRAKSTQVIDGKKVSEMGADEFVAAIEKQQKAVEEAKKKVDAYNKAKGGGIASNKTDKGNAVERQKEYDLALKQREEQAKKVQAAENALAAAEIAATRNAAERERKERENQHRLALQQIDDEEEEMKKRQVESMRQLWEAQKENKGKAWADTATAKDIAKNGYANIVLPEEDMKLLEARRKQVNEESKRDQHATAEALIREYQSYTDKKEAIDEKYREDTERINAAIVEAQERGDQQAVEALRRSLAEAAKERAKGQAQLSLEQLKETPEYVRAFEDLEQTSTRTLEMLIGMFEEAKKAAAQSMNPEDLREYTQTLQQLYDEVGRRDPFRAMASSSKELEEAQERTRVAASRLTAVQQKQQIPVLFEIDKATGKLVVEYLTLEKAEKDLAEAEDDEAKKRQKHKKAVKEAGDKIEELASSIRGLGDAMGGMGGEILNIIGDVMSVTVSTINAINFTSQSASKAIQAVEKASVILAVISAALQVVMKIAEVAKGLFGADDGEQFEKAKQSYEALSDVWDELIEKKREYLDESWGKEAKAATEEIIRLLEAEQKQAEILARQRLNVTNGSHSMWYRMWQGSYTSNRDDNIGAVNEGVNLTLPFTNAVRAINWRDVNHAIEQGLKEAGLGDVVFNSMEDMLTFTSEQLDWIKTNYTGLWTAMDDDFRELLEKHASLTGDMEEAIKAMQERMTGTTAENVIEDFMEALYEFADGSADVMEEVADDWQQMVNRMAVNTLVTQELKERLTKWYENLAKIEEDYTSGIIDETTYRNRLNAAQTEYNSTLDETHQRMTTLQEMGVIKPIEETAKEISEVFDSIRDAWASAVMGMKEDGESLGKEIARIMFEQLVKSNVLNKDFDDWLKNWVSRYEAALNVKAPGEREGQLRQLEEERKNKIHALTEATKAYADAAGYAAEEDSEFTNSLDNLGDTLLNALLDTETDAAEMGKKIAQNLIREMLSEMLASEKYAGRIAKIRQMWQDILSENDKEHTYKDVLNEIAALNNDIANDEAISSLADQYKLLGENTDKAKSSFSNLGDTILNSLTEANKTAEDFRDTLNKTLMNDLVKKQVLDVELTVNGQPFESFNEYLEDWMKRYEKALAEGNEERLDTLIDEMAAERKKLDDAARRLRDKYTRNVNDTTFKNMTDGFVSSLMDMGVTAEDWSENIGRTMAQRIIEQMVTVKYIQPLLDNVQDAFNAAMEAGTTTDAEGNEQYDWKAVLNNDGLKAALADMQSKYPELKEVVTKIMELAGLKGETPELPFSDLRSHLLSALTDMEGDAESFGEAIGKTLITEMLGQLMDAKFAGRIKEIREHWADALAGLNGHTLDSVKQEILELNEAASNDEDIKGYTAALKAMGKVAEDTDDTFSSMTDSLVNALTDMDTTAADFGKQIGKTLVSNLVKELVVMPFLQPMLDQLQKAVNDQLKNPGATVEGVLWAVRGLLSQIVTETEEMEPVIEEFMQPFLDMPDELEDAKVAFEDLGDVIVSSLTNAGQSAEDFGKEIGQKLAEQMLKQMVATKFAAAISGIQQDMQDALDGKEGAKSIEEIRKSIVDLRADAKETGKELMKFWEETDPKEEPFKDMRNSFRSTLTDMEADAKDFRKKLNQMLVDDLLDRQLSIPLTVDIGDETQVFEKGFDEYMENWNERYMNIVNATNLTQDEKIKYLDRLLDELAGVEQKYADATEDLRERLKKIEKDTTFSDMRDSFLDALMDMENGAESFAESLKRTIMRKVLEATMMENTIKPLMESLQDTISLALKDKYLETPAQMMDVIMHHGYGGNASGDFVISEVERLGKVYEPLLKAFGLYEEQAKEGFSDLRGTLVSALMGMEGDIDNFETHVEQFGKDMRKSMTEQMLSAYIGKNKEWSEELKQLNKDWSEALEAGDTTKLEEIRGKVETLYKTIGDDETVKDLSKKLKELEQAYDETFTSMSGNFVSMLMDFNATADDWGREIGTTLARRIIEEMMMKQYITPYLEKVQKAFNDAITTKGATTATVQAELQKYVNEAKEAFNKAAPAIRELMNTFQLFPEAAATPIDDLRSSFRSALMDMKADTKDFGDDITKILTEAFIDSFVLDETFDNNLKEWKARYEAIMGSKKSEDEIARQLKQLKTDIANTKQVYADRARSIHELMGTGNVADQSAYMNTAQNFTYDQAELVSGMMTNLVLGQGQANAVREQILATLQSIKNITAPRNDYGQQIFLRLGTTNDYLLDIRNDIRKQLGSLGQIESNTTNLKNLC